MNNSKAILELLDTMVPSPAAPAVGELPFANAQWPVYCLKGAELSLSAGLPASRYVCALLHDGSGGYLGLACDTVEQLAAEAVSLRPVPHCMRSDTMLITELALESEQNVLWVCNVRHLVSWLSRNSEGVNHG